MATFELDIEHPAYAVGPAEMGVPHSTTPLAGRGEGGAARASTRDPDILIITSYSENEDVVPSLWLTTSYRTLRFPFSLKGFQIDLPSITAVSLLRRRRIGLPPRNLRRDLRHAWMA